MTDSFLLYNYPWLLIIILFFWIALIWSNFGAIRRILAPLITIRGWGAVALFFLAALVIRLAIFPPRHQVYFDEFLHEDAAENISRANTFGESLAGGSDEYRLLQTPSWPGGYHVLMGSLFKITGPSETAAFRFNALLASLSVVITFLLATLIFEDQTTGFLSALLLTALPVHIRFSGTTDLSACSVLWVLIALLALALYLRIETFPMYLLLLASLLYSVNVRFENLILIPFAAVILLQRRRRSGSVSKDGYLIASCAFAWLLTPVMALLLRNRSHGLSGFDDPLMGLLRNLTNNLPPNVAYLLNSWPNVVVLIPAIIFGLLQAEKASRDWMKALLALGLGYLVLCSCHVGGDFNAGSTERLAIPVILSIILTASGGLKVLMARVRSHTLCASLVLAAFVLCALPSYGNLPKARHEAEYRLITDSADLLPRDAYVLSYCAPVIIVSARRPAATSFLALQGGEAFLDTLDHMGTRPVILFKDVWWYKFEGLSNQLEKMLRSRYSIEPLKIADIDSKEYGFYRMTRIRRASKVIKQTR